LQNEMQAVFDGWIQQSAVVTTPWTPWQTPNAAGLDAQSLQAYIPATPENVADAIETEFELNNTMLPEKQSWLANLAQFQAGGGQGFFDDTEIFRCTAGNQQLASFLLGAGNLSVTQELVTEIDTSSGVTLTFSGGGTAGPFDSVIVATSVAIWPSIQVDGAAFPYSVINNGPAIKYLAPLSTRFWIPQQLSPSGLFDTIGMTWEGTDNQADTAGFDLTVFAGGTAAAIPIAYEKAHGEVDTYYAPLVYELYPGFGTSGGTFANSPGDPYIKTGYSCPGPNQVVGAQQSYQTPYNGCLYAAGEHTSPAWFGFMEGALESGLVAALRMASAAGVDLLPEWGGTTAL
ncbi:MAG TPA: FAD-dependent oxidoreductase, partial [Thermoanaerobaculia bacterium]|nr:FAD-dependent oxidoreductase [Thermoanaerobaculia bacterium]